MATFNSKLLVYQRVNTKRMYITVLSVLVTTENDWKPRLAVWNPKSTHSFKSARLQKTHRFDAQTFCDAERLKSSIVSLCATAMLRTKSWGIYNTRHNDWLVDLGYVKDRVGKITIQNPALLENIIFPLKILSNWQLPQDGYQTFRGEALGVYSTSRL